MSDTDNDISVIILPVLFRHDVRTFCNYFLVFSAEKTAAKFMFFLPFQHRLQVFNCDVIEIVWLCHLFPAFFRNLDPCFFNILTKIV